MHNAQRYARNFLDCKRARLLLLKKLWDKIEKKYIQSILSRKKEQSKQEVSAKTVQILNLDPQLKIAMKRADVRWEMIDNRMENNIIKLKLTGVLGNVANDDNITKFMIAEDIKMIYLTNLVEKNRKEHLLERDSIIKAIVSQDTDYTIQDVKNMLAGTEVKRIKQHVKLPFAPFQFLRYD